MNSLSKMQFYNTLSRRIENFTPINTDRVNLFVCGPTVYNFPHIGNAKTYIQFDVLAKSLRYSGYNVFYLQNITDIDDKIIKSAKEHNESWKDVALKYEKAYLEDMQSLGVDAVNKYARATDFIPSIIKQIETLMTKGYAYQIEDGIYFETSKFKEYGKLSGRTDLKENDAVSRIDEASNKRGWNDFCLWKAEKPGEPSWESPFGKGRPGWHIEDTAITEAAFGPQYDIHGGAVDLIFPHHECEIAQMESASGLSPLVRYWAHAGFLNLNSQKMSKSTGNIVTVRSLAEQGIHPRAFRLWVLMSHYRSTMNWNDEALQAANTALNRLYEIFKNFGEATGIISPKYQQEFKNYIADDLDTPKAVALVWEMLKDKELPEADKKATLLDFDKVLGLGLADIQEDIIPEEVMMLVTEREQARVNKNFTQSDSLRGKINSLGYEVKDTPEGPRLQKL